MSDPLNDHEQRRGPGGHRATGRDDRGSDRGRRDDRGRQRPAARVEGAGHRSAQAPSRRARTGDPARRAAHDLLLAVDDGAYANLELQRILRAARLHGRDAAFATELAYGTLRGQGLYDAVIARGAGRPVAQIDPPVLATLRLGAHQLLGMRVPGHAAVAETVGLAREVNGAGAAGFVNAVLRRVSERTRDEWLASLLPEGTDDVDRLALTHSHPQWVVRALRSALVADGAPTGVPTGATSEAEPARDAEGTDPAAAVEALLAADNEPPLVAVCARPGVAWVEDLVEAGADPSALSPVGVVLPGGEPGEWPAIRDGRAAVQDEGSQLLALALADVPLEGPDERWLDLCAGPGGKAGLLAALAASRGGMLVANEVSEHRARLVERSVAAVVEAGGDVDVRVGDGREVGAAEPVAYDRVLVDAPCSGLGSLRRRPESRWRRTPADVTALAPLQRDLLRSALDAVRVGGVVGYATCSPHLPETRAVVDDVLRGRDDVELLDAAEAMQAVALAPLHLTGPYAQLWPHVHGTDAMFLALLRRTA